MEGGSSHYRLRCGIHFTCDLFSAAKTTQSEQAHHCQTAKTRKTPRYQERKGPSPTTVQTTHQI